MIKLVSVVWWHFVVRERGGVTELDLVVSCCESMEE